MDPNVEVGRIFHGRGGVWPGWEFVNIDFYGPYLLIQVFVKKDQVDFNQKKQIDYFISSLNSRFENIIIHWRKDKIFDAIKGSLPLSHFWCKERELKFEVSIGKDQNTGIFLDALSLRNFIQNNSQFKTILNLFSYTCTLSVCALKGGARKVVNVDMKSSFLNWGKRNHEINNLDQRSAVFLKGKVQKMIKKISAHGPFDILIVDPPSIQKENFDLTREYPKLILKLLPLASDRARFVLCCNSPHLNINQFQEMIESTTNLLEFSKHLHLDPVFAERDVNLGTKFLVFSKK